MQNEENFLWHADTESFVLLMFMNGFYECSKDHHALLALIIKLTFKSLLFEVATILKEV